MGHIEREEDWLRREIETALDSQRNIVPLMLDGFTFANPTIAERLTGSLAPLKSYNGLTIPVEYFDEAMNRLRTRHLSVPVDAVLHPPSARAKEIASQQQTALAATTEPAPVELTAEQMFEQAYESDDPGEKITLYSQAYDPTLHGRKRGNPKPSNGKRLLNTAKS